MNVRTNEKPIGNAVNKQKAEHPGHDEEIAVDRLAQRAGRLWRVRSSDLGPT